MSSQCIFWITDDYKVFAFGRNQYYQMGVGHKMDLIQPTQIEWFRGAVIDIQCADKYSVALCNVRTAVPFILKAWMESLVSCNCFLPAEIVQVTQAFCDSGVVYKTRYSPGLIEYASDNKYWTQLKGMNGKFERANIVQVRCGVCFSLFLDRRGRIWGYGSNEQQQLGIDVWIVYRRIRCNVDILHNERFELHASNVVQHIASLWMTKAMRTHGVITNGFSSAISMTVTRWVDLPRCKDLFMNRLWTFNVALIIL